MLVAGTVPWSLCILQDYRGGGGGGWRWWRSLPLAHMWDATELTFLALAHMWDATQLTILALAHMRDATQLMGWGGVGWGWWRSFAGTQCIDRAWGVCKTFIPKQIQKKNQQKGRSVQNPLYKTRLFQWVWRRNVVETGVKTPQEFLTKLGFACTWQAYRCSKLTTLEKKWTSFGLWTKNKFFRATRN